MRQIFRKYSLSFLALITIFCVSTQFVVLAKTGTVVKNTGVRHIVCTSLSTQAKNYYRTNNAGFDEFSKLKGGSSNCLTTVDSDLYDELHDLMDETMTSSTSYSNLKSKWPLTDASNGSSTQVYFYSDYVSSSSFSREHVWPKSHASFLEKDGGADPHHLRPENSSVNSTRSNLLFANVKGVVSNYSTKQADGKAVLYYGSGKVEVNDNIKGDVARVLLYVYCRWEEPNLFMDTPNPVKAPDDNQNTGKKVIESLSTLLEWCEEDPVDTWEMSRNDQCENWVGNRNVFIDYPEYAWLLFGRNVPTNMTTPSGEAKSGNSGNQGGNQDDKDDNTSSGTQGGNQDDNNDTNSSVGGGTNNDNDNTNNDNNTTNDNNGGSNNNSDNGNQGGIANKPNNGGKPFDPNAIGGQQVQTDGGEEYVLEPWAIIAIVAGAVVLVAGAVVAVVVIKKKKTK